MFYRVSDLHLLPGQSQKLLWKKAANEINVDEKSIIKLKIYRCSLDARKGKVLFRYTVDVYLNSSVQPKITPSCLVVEKEFEYEIPKFASPKKRPLVVGFGPAGMFASLLLARAGMEPIVIERGKRMEERVRDVEKFFSVGVLNPLSNVQFGEGGAGTFSDGKLNTLLKDKNRRGRFVLQEFVKAGAPEEIIYRNKPHIGTDRLRSIVKNIRNEIIALGGTIYFESTFLHPVVDAGRLIGAKIQSENGRITIPCDTIFLGIGHSARDTFLNLRNFGIRMEKKVFSIGVRIEHLQEELNRIQYGDQWDNPFLGAADYKLAVPTIGEKRLYTFCMCPGGVVVPATSDTNAVVTNGMSNFDRSGKNANSALLLNVLPDELGDDLFSGFEYQSKLERLAFLEGGENYRAPCQLVGDFMEGTVGHYFGKVEPSYSLGVTMTKMENILSIEQCDMLRKGIAAMGKKLPGFDAPDSVLTAVESRATCPVRILRDDSFQSSLKGVYPIGEGAGYAGGIMSSAMDGMRAVEAYFNLRKESLE